MRYVEKCGTARQITGDNTAERKNEAARLDTHRIFNF
jgi:hypothetical protein